MDLRLLNSLLCDPYWSVVAVVVVVVVAAAAAASTDALCVAIRWCASLGALSGVPGHNILPWGTTTDNRQQRDTGSVFHTVTL